MAADETLAYHERRNEQFEDNIKSFMSTVDQSYEDENVWIKV
jgi:hypothetical protein